MQHETKYEYSFSVGLDHSREWDPHIIDVFQMLGRRVERIFTQWEFENFRAALARHGMALCDIERVPFVEPEAIQ